MLFDKIIGQEGVKKKLVEMVEKNRLPHALLFLGKEGSGALSLAIAFAQWIISQPKNEADLFAAEPAAKPLSIEDIEKSDTFYRASQLIHPDLHFTYPVIPKKAGDKPKSTDYLKEWRQFVKDQPYGNLFDWLQHIQAENKQGNITAEECQDISAKLSLQSYEGGVKILIIWMPEFLGKEGNKLLKLIEEPPPNTLFFLVAENESMILPTILSRCQLIKLAPLSIEDIQNALINKENILIETAHPIAVLADGNYREALQLLKEDENNWYKILEDWLKYTVRKMLPEQVKWTEEINKLGREKQKQFLKFFVYLIAQTIRIKILGADQTTLLDRDKDFALRVGKIAQIHQLEAIAEMLEKAIYHIERNANGKMLFQALTIELYYMLKQEKKVALN